MHRFTSHTDLTHFLCPLALWVAISVHGQPVFDFIKIADLSDAIPNGTGNFTGLGRPANNGSTVVFRGTGSGIQGGIYQSSNGVLTRVVDKNTPVPGAPESASFEVLNMGEPSARGTGVVFQAKAVSGFAVLDEGIYRADGTTQEVIAHIGTPIPDSSSFFTGFDVAPFASGPRTVFAGGNFNSWGLYQDETNVLTRVADSNTPIPSGTGNFMGGTVARPGFYGHSIDGTNVAFIGFGANGQQGIYLASGTNLVRVADKTTPIPSGTNTFTTFGYACVSGTNVVFFGEGTNGQLGIYASIGGTLVRVADKNTSIPGGTGKFTGFDNDGRAPSLEGQNVAFLGNGSGQQQGLYLYTHSNGTLTKVIGRNSVLGGKSVLFLPILHTEAMSGDSIAFLATFTDGTAGIWKAVPRAPFRPALRIEAVPPASVRLLWPTNDPGFNLQFSTNLDTTNWAAALPLPVVLGTNNIVTNAASGAQKFYRLFKP